MMMNKMKLGKEQQINGEEKDEISCIRKIAESQNKFSK